MAAGGDVLAAEPIPLGSERELQKELERVARDLNLKVRPSVCWSCLCAQRVSGMDRWQAVDCGRLQTGQWATPVVE